MRDTSRSAADDPDTTATVMRALGDVVVSVEAAIARLQGDDAPPGLVTQLLDIAGAPDLGDVVARHNALTRAVAIVDQRGALPEAEWDAVAGHGADLAVAVDRLREHAESVLDAEETAPETEAGADPVPGATALVTASTDGLLGETLHLLVLVEGCLAAWHRLRVAHAAPAERSGAVADARTVLAEHLHRDGELLRRARLALARVSAATPFETVRRLSSARTVRTLAQLRRDLEDFRSACGADAAGWLDDEAPGTDAELAAVDNPFRVVGDALGRGLARVAEVRRRGDDGSDREPSDDEHPVPDPRACS